MEATEQKQQLELLIVPGDGASLLGRDWLRCLKLDWTQIHHLNCSDTLQAVLDRHSNVFESSLGLVQGTTAKIHVDPITTPKLFKARPVPYALCDKVDKEPDHLEKKGVIQPITHSEWAAPVVPVGKCDGSVRL